MTCLRSVLMRFLLWEQKKSRTGATVEVLRPQLSDEPRSIIGTPSMFFALSFVVFLGHGSVHLGLFGLFVCLCLGDVERSSRLVLRYGAYPKPWLGPSGE